jgi:hypothetical protein
VPVWGVVVVLVCGACAVVVLGWASASDTSNTMGDTVKLNAAIPKKMEKAPRREIFSLSLFSVTSNLPI